MKWTKKLNCETCGDLDHAVLDGYLFGDTLLEGVEFKITVRSGKVTAEVMPDSAEYMKDLNSKKWLKEAVAFASEDDCDCMYCPKCHECGTGWIEAAS